MKKFPATVALAALAALSADSGRAAPSGSGGSETVWAIGRPDGSRTDFALGSRGNFEEFSKRFGEVVEFRVGRSKPGVDFPYILPGPADAWAGARPHALHVLFDLPGEPDGAYLLELRFCLTHYEQPPALEVSINGAPPEAFETPPDARAFAKLLRVPRGALHSGENVVAIKDLRGSWVEWDSLRLERFRADLPDLISGLRLGDTVLFREVDGVLSQVVRAAVDGIWDGRGSFRLRAGAEEKTIDAAAARAPGGAYELTVGKIERPTEVAFELVTASGARASATILVRPHRHWRIWAVMKTHYDLGYTHPVEEMLRNAAGPMLRKVLAYCGESRGNPPGKRFQWTYPSWLIGKIRELSAPPDRARFEDALRTDEVGWNALPFSLHSYFCGPEDLIRGLYLSADLERELGKRVLWAKQTDVPGHTRFLPQVLARAGVRLLQIGANNGVRGVKAPLLFHWQAPDGSRVLTQLTPGYGFGYDDAQLLRLESDPDYPADAFLAVYITGDNVGPGDLNRIPAMARDLAARYAYPQLVIGRPEEFAEVVEREFGDRIPVVRTELADWWIHGVASMARETALAREAREELPAAEKASSIALLLDPAFPWPAVEFRKGYERSLLFSEHTWGVAGFKPKPQPPGKRDLETNQSPEYRTMRHSWELKGDYAREAAAIAATALRGALEAAARASRLPAQTIVVFNALNWARSDLVRVPLADLPPPPFRIVDRAGGAGVPWQPDGSDAVFIARDVPPVGWALYAAEPGDARGQGGAAPEVRSRPGGEPVLEAGPYRIALDPATGAVSSLRAGGEELVDASAPWQLHQLVYEAAGKIGDVGWHGSPWEGPGTGRRTPHARSFRVEEGPVLSRIVSEGELAIDFPVEVGSIPSVVQSICVARDLPWIECETRLAGKRPTALAEAGHLAFPFRVPGGKFRVELLGSVVDPERDVQEAGNRDVFAVQHWVDVSSAERGITWCPVEATITSLGEIRLFRWDPAYVPSSSAIYSNIFNNGWSTNFQEWQGGDFHHRYRFRPHQGDHLRGEAARFGWETAQPLAALVVRGPATIAAGAGRSTAGETAMSARASFLLADSATAVLLVLKRAEDGRGFIARLLETAGRAGEVRLTCPLRSIRSAERTDITERPLEKGAGRLEVRDGEARLPIGAWAVETVRLEI